MFKTLADKERAIDAVLTAATRLECDNLHADGGEYTSEIFSVDADGAWCCGAAADADGYICYATLSDVTYYCPEARELIERLGRIAREDVAEAH